MPYKITLVGGGSSMFTPQLTALFVKSKILAGSTITLMDINPSRLETMEKLSKHLIQIGGAQLRVETMTDRRASLVDADFVIVAIAVGGFDAWEMDLEIPARYGIYQPIGDSVGPGGIMRAFRHIPVLVALVQELQEVSPHAVVFNYSNPATTLCMAMRQESSIKALSLCTNSPLLRDEEFLAGFVDAGPGELVVPPPAAGLNHCAGILSLEFKDGRDAFPLIRENNDHPVIRWGLDHYGILPYAWPHWQEFYPQLCKLDLPYQGRLQGLTMKYGHPVKDMDQERERVSKWEAIVRNWMNGAGEEITLDNLPVDEPVQVVEIMEAMLLDKNEVHAVVVPNHGAIDNLPYDAVVEVSAIVNANGITPVHVGPLPQAIADFLTMHVSVYKLVVQAGLTGDRRLAFQAFFQDPIVASQLTIEETEEMIEELFQAEKQWLPQFFPS